MSFAAGAATGGTTAILGAILGAILSKRGGDKKMQAFLGEVNDLKPALVRNFESLGQQISTIDDGLGQTQDEVRRLGADSQVFQDVTARLEAQIGELSQTAITREELNQAVVRMAQGEASKAMQQRQEFIARQQGAASDAQINQAVQAQLAALQERVTRAGAALESLPDPRAQFQGML